jgi:hypothetical protein
MRSKFQIKLVYLFFNDDRIKMNPANFVRHVSCFNTITSTNIMCKRECRLYSVRKIRTFVAERYDRDPSTVELDLLITAISRITGYGRIGAGILLCLLGPYGSKEYYRELLNAFEFEQDHELLWIEPFLRFAHEYGYEHVSDSESDEDTGETLTDIDNRIASLINSMLAEPEWSFLPFDNTVKLVTVVTID